MNSVNDRHDEDDAFESGFHNLTSSALKYEYYKRNNLEIPKDVQEDLKKAFNWVENLSDEEYSSLIH